MIALQVLKDPVYRRFWIALLVSQFGGWMQSASLAWLVITLTGSAERLGLVIAFLFLPSLFLALPAGALADRLPRKMLVFYAQGAMMVLALTMALLILAHRATFGELLAFALLFGSASAVDVPVRQAMTVELAGRERYPGAISLNSFAFNFNRLIAPAVAGLVIATLGIGWAFLINACTFIPLLFVLFGLPSHPPQEAGGSLIFQVRDGLHYVRSTPLVLSVLLLVGWLSVFALNFQTLIPAYSRLVLGLQASGYGLMVSALGAGALVGAVLQAVTGGARPLRVLLGGGLVACSLLLLALPAPSSLVALFWPIGGFGMITSLINANASVQTAVPNRLRGRVMSIYSLVLQGTGPLGAYLTGLAVQLLGGRQGALVLGIISLLGVLAFSRIRWPRTVAFPAD